MKTIIQNKTATFSGVIPALLLITFFISCKKDIHNDTAGIPDEIPDLSAKINSSVSGFVTNENNEPVRGAFVTVGTASAITNQFGHFQVKNVEVVKTAAVVTISKTGYFKAIKTWAATTGKAAFFSIKLLPKTIAGTFSANTGGTVSLSNGLVVSIPSGAVVVASNNNAYNGEVSVAAQWIDPEASDLHQIMPGDLRAIDKNGFMKLLTSFGMAAVELTGSSGELLQIATGKKATLTMPMSAQVSANAPSSIPLWYFDEINGLWKEEGTATKAGNTYVGEVSHFSYWNSDLPNASVALNFTIVDGSGNPLQNIHVDITPAPGNPYPWTHSGGYTDTTGYVSTFVSPNTTYNLKVFGFNGSCSNNAIYTQTFSVTTTPLSLGNVVVAGTGVSDVLVSGSVTDCNGNIVTNGNVYVSSGDGNFVYPLDINGNYQFSTVTCTATNNTVITAVDLAQNQQSAAQVITINPGANTIPVIQACGAAIFNYISNGYLYHPTSSRSIDAYPKTLETLNATSVLCDIGDLGPSGYKAILDVDPVTFHITISAAPGAAGLPYFQWDSGLPTTAPGPVYTTAWPGSAQCNNTYNPTTLIYYLRYGYIGGTGYRISEEILSPQ